MAHAGETALLSTLNDLVTDLLGWLGDYPDDQVSPAALATIPGDHHAQDPPLRFHTHNIA